MRWKDFSEPKHGNMKEWKRVSFIPSHPRHSSLYLIPETVHSVSSPTQFTLSHPRHSSLYFIPDTVHFYVTRY